MGTYPCLPPSTLPRHRARSYYSMIRSDNAAQISSCETSFCKAIFRAPEPSHHRSTTPTGSASTLSSPRSSRHLTRCGQMSLPRIEHACGDHRAVRVLYEEALLMERQVKDAATEQATLFQLGRLALDEGRISD